VTKFVLAILKPFSLRARNLNDALLSVTTNEGKEIEGKLLVVGEQEIEIEEEKGKGKKKEVVKHVIPYSEIKSTVVKIIF
jgi:ribosome maturation factor RimP